MEMKLLAQLNWEDITSGIPWAGLGALLLGLGSTLSGVAAVITARRAAKGRENDQNRANSDTDRNRVSHGGGERVPSSDSTESGPSSAT